ncbi:phosphomethylpyrimidine synthase ThiC [Peptostreptococcus equinus]|uniref:Phosphomethylpyrimidine synthase n=1 Tax=Peptostreptococcus equinus TaxID=3003601 RepID=A0ABY7JQL5_9FIRM|nr:phosphomethylpyrimidine synthase ThiC [Peptostreptococcus sp. CBA3647]WAW15410.1 phosphomethylpyrimidine synthase ThiC [Peptostreptococcus sp. CBA3647]
MNNYTTQMDAAKKGILTQQMKRVAEKEFIDPKVLMQRVAKGEIAIPANKNHKSLLAEGVGTGLSTKINVNLGISRDCPDVDKELEKVKKAIDMKAEAIMDLSSFGKTEEFRQKLIAMSSAMIGTVPVYDAIGFYDKELKDITSDEFLDVVRKHAKDGVDFVTIHAGMNKEAMKIFKRNKRITNIVSRGGSLMYAWMELNNAENPFFERFDELLEICQEYDLTLSLGDAMRPGCLNDSTDACQIKELTTLGELTLRAWEKNVQVIIEGPGHMAIDEIEANVKLEKRLCHNAPFYVLGPIVTDIAPGYDHITSAIGGAIAASAGVDFLCYVTPAEHLRLPDLEDMKEGIIATKIAAHAADIAKKIPKAMDWDNKMAKARADIDWEVMFNLAIDEDKARKYREESTPEHSDTCTMCGKMCSMRTMKKIMAGEDLNILRDDK